MRMWRAGTTAASVEGAPVAESAATGPPAAASFRSLCRVMREEKFPQMLEGAVGIAIASLLGELRHREAGAAPGDGRWTA